MATLHARNIPDWLYERLRQRAARERRSVSAQVAVILDQCLGQSDDETWALLARADALRASQSLRTDSPSEAFVREDRER